MSFTVICWCYRQFEDIQGRLEAAIEQCSVPLALLPDVQVSTHTAQCWCRSFPDCSIFSLANSIDL